MASRHFLKRHAGSLRHFRDRHFGQQLARLNGRRKEAGEEISRRDRSRSFRSAQLESRIEREHHRRQLGRRISVREAASDRAAVANRRMRDERHRLGDEWQLARDQGAALYRPLARHAADSNGALRILYVGQIIETVQVDEHGRRCQTEIHGWYQALPTRQRLGVAGMLCKERQCLLDCPRAKVFERSWLHLCISICDLLIGD